MPRLLALLLLLPACAGPPKTTTEPATESTTGPTRSSLEASNLERLVVPAKAAAPPVSELGVKVAAPSEGDVDDEGEAADARPVLPDEPLHPKLLTQCDEARRIVVHKAARRLDLRCGDKLAARYEAGLGFDPLGDKHHEGDGRTPEGEYYITSKYISGFHRSLQLSYPNVADADRGLGEGQISKRQHAAIVRANAWCKLPPQTTNLGSLLQIHGGGGRVDWTLGCVAIDNEAIEAAYAFHLPGCRGGVPRTRVLILP